MTRNFAIFLAVAFVALLFASGAKAQTASTLGQTSSVQGRSEATNAGNSQVVNFINGGATGPAVAYTRVEGRTSVDTTPNVFSPSLTAGGITCLGSKSIGGSITGLGASGGSTFEDDPCNAREAAKLYAAWGLRGVALARLCLVDKEREALESDGVFKCPQTKLAEQAALDDRMRAVSVTTDRPGVYVGSDPLVLERLQRQGKL